MGANGDMAAEAPRPTPSALDQLFDGRADPFVPEPDDQPDPGSDPEAEDRHD